MGGRPPLEVAALGGRFAWQTHRRPHGQPSGRSVSAARAADTVDVALPSWLIFLFSAASGVLLFRKLRRWLRGAAERRAADDPPRPGTDRTEESVRGGPRPSP